MNCHRARQLISPYLDQRLTGREMLALHQHFSECATCEAERRSISQVKTLLRALHGPRPRTDLPRAISVRLAERDQPWRLTLLTMAPAWRPQRGRRLVTALALSCLTVLSFAAACFAPAAHTGALASSGFFLPLGLPPTRTMPTDEAMSPLADVSRPDFLNQTGTDEVRRERLFIGQGEAPPPDLRLSPLPSGSVPDYMQGQASFADYRTR